MSRKASVRQWDRELQFLQRQVENYLRANGAQIELKSSNNEQANAVTYKNEVETSLENIRSLVKKPSPYLSQHGASVLLSVKVFAEKMEELVKSYWILLDRMLWAKLVVGKLTNNVSIVLTTTSIQFCGQKLNALVNMRETQKRSLTKLAKLESKLNADFEYLELAHLNREATELQAPFMLNKARRLFFNAVHN